MLKKTLKVLCVLIVAVLVCAVVLIAWLSVTEYKPKAVEKAEIYDSEATGLLDKNESIKILSFNTGYAGLGEEADFFMDGGKSAWAKDEESVMAGICGMGEIINNVNPDFVLMQEVDVDGTRSYHVDELALMNQFVKGYYYTYAQNYDSPFLFFPPWQPIGANKSGIVTYSRNGIADAMRRSLPISETFSKLVDLDRCYSIARIPMEEGKSLCLYNIHMSAYGSSDEIREGQLSMLYEDMEADDND